ncbi:MAG: EAL domain-containing response regulator [Myxococcales bacterium]|nr:EAL domain-containing response regulator [Myxococcales bacterium]
MTPTSQAPRDTRILLVDDEPTLLKALARHLEYEGLEVATCESAREALDLLEKERFDVLVSDIAMPGMSGVELLRAVKSSQRHLPVILITGAPDVHSAVQALELGAFKYLLKPIDSKEFVEVVVRAAKLHRLALVKADASSELGGGIVVSSELAALEADFRRAMDSLWMAYQPIIRAQDASIYGYEALLRTRDPVLDNPGKLIGAAERLEQVWPLGRRIREHVAADMANADPRAYVFVNLHPIDLMDPELYGDDSALASIAGRVVLEITERATLDDVKEPAERIAKLRKQGYRIAVDDLGAGYAGLSSFAQLEPDLVKLDMSLIRDVDSSPVKRRLVASMVSLCSDLALMVVAEGIETERERDVLVDLGCHLLQGYRFGRPAEPFSSASW